MLRENQQETPETYDCERCGSVVDVAKHGRRRLASLKQAVCSKCFGEVMAPLTAEAERRIAELRAKNYPKADVKEAA